ncbi:MAG: PepSY domain-containing protein [Pseudomonadales bacterium]|nr:PepSY domain-containing protein [Pseudomonadales bacterium]
MRLKPWLYFLHRWLGIGMCLLIALWFASGIVMMYVDYPQLTETERVQNLLPLDSAAIRMTVNQAMRYQGAEPVVSDLRLSSLMGRPLWQLRYHNGAMSTIFADTGQPLRGVDAEQALEVVRHSGFGAAGFALAHEGLVDIDQWTVSAAPATLRPLHKISIADGQGTVVYVSAVSGQIVRDTRRQERLWNWVGSTIHWIYPLALRRHADIWAQVVIWLSLIGMVTVLSGAIIGFTRLRIRRPDTHSSISPYRGVGKWHHLLGLGCLVFLLTFLFSGFLSMQPWGLFSSGEPLSNQLQRYTAGQLGADGKLLPELPKQLPAGVREVRWRQLDGEPYILFTLAPERHLVSHAGQPEPAEPSALHGLIEQAVPELLPQARVQDSRVLRQHDAYYYSMHGRHRPLPALQVQFDDPDESGYYIDLATGEVILRHTRNSRLARWLYNGLHSFDFPLLRENRPLWDILLLILCLSGLVFSISSIMLGWRRLLH